MFTKSLIKKFEKQIEDLFHTYSRSNLLFKSINTLKAAALCYEHEYYGSSIQRLYYCFFMTIWDVNDIKQNKRQKESKHEINLEFIKEKNNSKISNIYSNLKRLRGMADYEDSIIKRGMIESKIKKKDIEELLTFINEMI